MTAAESARDEAMATVEENANAVWKVCARVAISELARTRLTFTTEDVWEFMELHYPTVSTRERRAMGPMMTAAAADGEIVATDVFVKGERRSRHAAPIRVWASLVSS